jgi:hypothetical protein
VSGLTSRSVPVAQANAPVGTQSVGAAPTPASLDGFATLNPRLDPRCRWVSRNTHEYDPSPRSSARRNWPASIATGE